MLKCGGISDLIQRRVEIAEPDIREFIPDLRDQALDSNLLFAQVRSELVQIPVGVDVQVSHLDQIQAGFGYQLPESVPFAFLICKSGENEIIDGCETRRSF